VSTRIEAVVSDFGGVLTTPLAGSFEAFYAHSGVTAEQLGNAIVAITTQLGANPLFELETGRLSEPEFLGSLAEELTKLAGRPVALTGFGERYFAELAPNDAVIEYMRSLRARGYKLAICTNNVREWEPLWRSIIPVDELFDVVVDSAFVGTRKPEPRIYELTLERLGVAAPAAVLIDDIELNCTAARELGMPAVWFQTSEQAIADVEAILADGSA
jgi:putative hydrolase of the HAD superfamily